MAMILRLLGDERSAIASRHMRMASIWAVASVVAGISLMVVGGSLYEESSRQVIWALDERLGSLAG